MKRTIATIVALLFCTSCSVPADVLTRSQQAIADQGYTQIEYEGFAWNSCGEDDSFALKYSATARNSRRVTLAACSGWFKGVTVRTLN